MNKNIQITPTDPDSDNINDNFNNTNGCLIYSHTLLLQNKIVIAQHWDVLNCIQCLLFYFRNALFLLQNRNKHIVDYSCKHVMQLLSCMKNLERLIAPTEEINKSDTM